MVEGEISFGRFRLDLARRELRRDEKPVRLGSRALDILCVLASARGKVGSQCELMERVWVPVSRRISIADQRGWADVCEALFIYVVTRIVPAHRHYETLPSRSSPGVTTPGVGAPPIRAVQVSSQLSRCPYQGRRL